MTILEQLIIIYDILCPVFRHNLFWNIEFLKSKWLFGWLASFWLSDILKPHGTMRTTPIRPKFDQNLRYFQKTLLSISSKWPIYKDPKNVAGFDFKKRHLFTWNNGNIKHALIDKRNRKLNTVKKVFQLGRTLILLLRKLHYKFKLLYFKFESK